eukprot:1516668-Pleurochrysis_carterae.AAC.1
MYGGMYAQSWLCACTRVRARARARAGACAYVVAELPYLKCVWRKGEWPDGCVRAASTRKHARARARSREFAPELGCSRKKAGSHARTQPRARVNARLSVHARLNAWASKPA